MLKVATLESLAKELESAKKALEETERKQHQLQEQQHDQERQQPSQQQESIPVRLNKLLQTADSLRLAQEVAEWMDTFSLSSEKEEDSNIFQEAQLCHGLAELLLRHENVLELSPSLYEKTYLPLYHYVYECLVAMLRQELNAYPKACPELLQECRQKTSQFPNICHQLIRLEQVHHKVLSTIEGHAPQTQSVVLLELFGPVVDRVRFHFVERSEERVTSSRIDRLPEWLLTYLREHVLEEGGPHELVQSLKDASLSMAFLNELVRLIQWVLTERNFFRDLKIVGPRSNSLLLYNAMEQLLLFDRTLQESAPSGAISEQQQLIGLMDLLVAPDEELMKWWMERERESVFSTLFEDDSSVNVPKPLANHVSPRAEIFCALIRSVQYKASVLTAPGPYLRHVAVPLCSQFVDALHETSTDLRNLLCQSLVGGLPSEQQMLANLNEWIEIINGTHLAASVLLREGSWRDGMPSTSQSDHDLARFGRSLERLQDVMVEEFAASYVETILMERAKLASYLMMASHLLASEQWDGDYETDLSAELRETKVVLHQFHQVCNSILAIQEEGDNEPSPDQEIAQFAPRAMRTHVMNRVADKFIEVALDVHDMTPDIWLEGAKVFARDVAVMMGSSTDMPLVLRLLDVTKLLSLDTKSIQALMAALGGLVGASTILDVYDFSSDGTLYEEATSMIKAKGFISIELEDVVSILNRRRD